MIRELKDSQSYPRVIALISVLSVFFGIATCVLGELLLPLSSAFMATLFLLEKPKKRFLSYLCPAVCITVALLLKGIAAIVVIEAVLLAIVIDICYKKSLSKAETSIYLTLIIAVFVFASLYLSAAFATKNFSLESITNYYMDFFLKFKREFVDIFSGMTVTAEDGTVVNAMSVEEARMYFSTLTNSFVALIGILSFLLAGLTIKMYAVLVLKYSRHGILKKFAHFLPSNFCAYSYLISSVLALFATQTSSFGIIIMNVNMIMMAVFAYMGVKYLLMVAKMSQKRSLIYCLIVFGIISLPSVVPSILSYLGVWVVIGTNLNNKTANV